MSKRIIPHVLGNKDNRVYEIRVCEMTESLKKIVDKKNLEHSAVKKKYISSAEMKAMKEQFWVMKKIGEVYNAIFAKSKK